MEGSKSVSSCGFCVGNDSTVPGRSWRMNINATTVFLDSTRVSDSAQIGASIYAEDGYNNQNIVEAECNGCYIDIAEICGLDRHRCSHSPERPKGHLCGHMGCLFDVLGAISCPACKS